jgi:opacity protein-like surface antigen
MKTFALLVALILVAGGGPAGASDFNPLGLYIGGSVGRSDVKTSIVSSPLVGFDETDTAWKALVGLRPVSLLAAELAYVDFGHPTSSTNLGVATRYENSLQKAPTLSGLVFAPIPLPMLDLYARVGIARLQSRGNEHFQCNPSSLCLAAFPYVAFDRTHTDFLYGAGAQLKLSALAVRLEYERIDDALGNPDLLSLGVTWTF